MSRALILWLASLLVLSGCFGNFETDYQYAVQANIPKHWRVARVEVLVPESLEVSEAELFAPPGDIVWRGEPLGDRRAQVGRILEEALYQGARGLNGRRPVILRAKLLRFHALTDRARKHLTFSGVHNIEFLIEVVDLRTGLAMSHTDRIEADVAAYVGKMAQASDARGEGQRRRIVGHVAKVVAGWLSLGPDPRGDFNRIGL